MPIWMASATFPPFKGSKNLRDTEYGVRIEFLIAGEFPGDRKPKAVAFPDPEAASVMIKGVRTLSLPKLIELKLASGMTGGIHRMKDFTDVIALIEALKLPADFAGDLNPYVRDKYLELWQAIQDSPVVPDEAWPEGRNAVFETDQTCTKPKSFCQLAWTA